MVFEEEEEEEEENSFADENKNSCQFLKRNLKAKYKGVKSSTNLENIIHGKFHFPLQKQKKVRNFDDHPFKVLDAPYL